MILRQRRFEVEYKIYALALKHDCTVAQISERFELLADGRVRFGGLTLRNLKTQGQPVRIELLQRRGDELPGSKAT